MKNNKNKLLLIVSIIMLIIALPMVYWCYIMIGMTSAKVDFPYASLGSFIACFIYFYLIITGIIGIVTYKKDKTKLAKISAYVGLIACAVDACLLLGYVLFTLLPAIILFVLYLIGLKRSKS